MRLNPIFILFIALTVITLLICNKSYGSDRHHWCGADIDGQPTYGLEKNFKGKPIEKDGHNRHKIPRCSRAEYQDKWGAKRVEYYRTKDGTVVRGIWYKACCLHPDGSTDIKYPYWEWWRER